MARECGQRCGDPPVVFSDTTMMVKHDVVAELGGEELLVPDRIARSLVANDQVKYYFGS
jgi:hypothetical protein